MQYERVKNLCRENGIKISYLEQQLGVWKGFFNNVAAGKTPISDNQLKIVANILGTTTAYLNGETEFKTAQAATTSESNSKLIQTLLEKEEIQRLWKRLMNGQIPLFRYSRYEGLRIKKHLTPNYVERKSDIPYDDLLKVRDGEINLSDSQVRKMALVLDTTYDYLMGLTDDPEIPAEGDDGIKIKVFGEVAAGIPIKQIDNFDPDDADSWEEIDRRTAKNGEYFALRIKGDSMEPRMFEGDTVIVRHQPSVESGEIAIVAINGDEATCKKVTYTADGMILNSLNPKYEPRFFSNERVQKLPVRILGKVVEIRGRP